MRLEELPTSDRVEDRRACLLVVPAALALVQLWYLP